MVVKTALQLLAESLTSKALPKREEPAKVDMISSQGIKCVACKTMHSQVVCLGLLYIGKPKHFCREVDQKRMHGLIQRGSMQACTPDVKGTCRVEMPKGSAGSFARILSREELQWERE